MMTNFKEWLYESILHKHPDIQKMKAALRIEEVNGRFQGKHPNEERITFEDDGIIVADRTEYRFVYDFSGQYKIPFPIADNGFQTSIQIRVHLEKEDFKMLPRNARYVAFQQQDISAYEYEYIDCIHFSNHGNNKDVILGKGKHRQTSLLHFSNIEIKNDVAKELVLLGCYNISSNTEYDEVMITGSQGSINTVYDKLKALEKIPKAKKYYMVYDFAEYKFGYHKNSFFTLFIKLFCDEKTNRLELTEEAAEFYYESVDKFKGEIKGLESLELLFKILKRYYKKMDSNVLEYFFSLLTDEQREKLQSRKSVNKFKL